MHLQVVPSESWAGPARALELDARGCTSIEALHAELSVALGHGVRVLAVEAWDMDFGEWITVGTPEDSLLAQVTPVKVRPIISGCEPMPVAELPKELSIPASTPESVVEALFESDADFEAQMNMDFLQEHYSDGNDSGPDDDMLQSDSEPESSVQQLEPKSGPHCERERKSQVELEPTSELEASDSSGLASNAQLKSAPGEELELEPEVVRTPESEPELELKPKPRLQTAIEAELQKGPQPAAHLDAATQPSCASKSSSQAGLHQIPTGQPSDNGHTRAERLAALEDQLATGMLGDGGWGRTEECLATADETSSLHTDKIDIQIDAVAKLETLTHKTQGGTRHVDNQHRAPVSSKAARREAVRLAALERQRLLLGLPASRTSAEPESPSKSSILSKPKTVGNRSRRPRQQSSDVIIVSAAQRMHRWKHQKDDELRKKQRRARSRGTVSVRKAIKSAHAGVPPTSIDRARDTAARAGFHLGQQQTLRSPSPAFGGHSPTGRLLGNNKLKTLISKGMTGRSPSRARAKSPYSHVQPRIFSNIGKGADVRKIHREDSSSPVAAKRSDKTQVKSPRVLLPARSKPLVFQGVSSDNPAQLLAIPSVETPLQNRRVNANPAYYFGFLREDAFVYVQPSTDEHGKVIQELDVVSRSKDGYKSALQQCSNSFTDSSTVSKWSLPQTSPTATVKRKKRAARKKSSTGNRANRINMSTPRSTQTQLRRQQRSHQLRQNWQTASTNTSTNTKHLHHRNRQPATSSFRPHDDEHIKMPTAVGTTDIEQRAAEAERQVAQLQRQLQKGWSRAQIKPFYSTKGSAEMASADDQAVLQPDTHAIGDIRGTETGLTPSDEDDDFGALELEKLSEELEATLAQQASAEMASADDQAVLQPDTHAIGDIRGTETGLTPSDEDDDFGALELEKLSEELEATLAQQASAEMASADDQAVLQPDTHAIGDIRGTETGLTPSDEDDDIGALELEKLSEELEATLAQQASAEMASADDQAVLQPDTHAIGDIRGTETGLTPSDEDDDIGALELEKLSEELEATLAQQASAEMASADDQAVQLPNPDKPPKLVMLGAPGVGKTSLVKRLVRNMCEDDQSPTVGIEHSTYPVSLFGQTLQLDIWDRGGGQTYGAVSKAFFKRSAGVLLVFDLGRSATLHKCMEICTHELCTFAKGVPVVLVGNKSDNHINISKEDIKHRVQQLETQLNQSPILYVETSAHSDERSVERAFAALMATTGDAAVTIPGLGSVIPPKLMAS